MFTLNKTPGRSVMVNGKEHLFFSGYSYLGIHHHPVFIKSLQESINEYGIFFPSSRISNTQLCIYNEVETFLNHHFLQISNQYHTALFSNGFLSGLAAQKIFNHHKKIFIAPNTHPAISQHSINISRQSWVTHLLNETQENNYEKVLIKSDSVDVLKSSVNNFDFLKEIPKNCTVDVLIDDSHGIGLIGNNGTGIANFLPIQNNLQYHFNYSLSKSYGIPGGAFSSTKENIDKIKNTVEFAATTPPIPAFLHSFLQHKELYSKQRELLVNNVIYFKEQITNLPILHQFPLPIFILPSFINESIFIKHNLIISSFSYPSENGEKYTRIVLNAHHTKPDLEFLLSVLQQAFA